MWFGLDDPDLDSDQIEHYMRLALQEAHIAFERNEVPVGAVVVVDNRVVGRGHNLVESLHDATAHAEMIAMSAAREHFGDWRLENSYLFSTLEPCIMCTGAAVLSRVKGIVYGADDPKFGGCWSVATIPLNPKLNHRVGVLDGVLEEEAAELMRRFFVRIRQFKKKVH